MMRKFSSLLILVSLAGCMFPGEIVRPELPSLAYTRGVHQQRFDLTNAQRAPQQPTQVKSAQQAFGQLQHTQQPMGTNGSIPQVQDAYQPEARARMQFVKDWPEEYNQPSGGQMEGASPGMVTNMQSPPVEFSPHGAAGHGGGGSYQVTRNTNPNVRPYQGPLHIGEPGASASLWRAQGEGSRLFRDHRAYQAMDLITIVVSETAEGIKEADTETTKESSFLAGISELFNFADSLEADNTGLDTATLLDADFDAEFTGEGETTRRGSLTARIAAMVVEVLPNGVMRVEGEKIISVNNEEQIIVISGLVRPRDVNSNNEVMSSKIAHLRVDYFGKGMLGDVQYVGWFGRVVHALWPF